MQETPTHMPSSSATAVRRKEQQALPRCNNLRKLLSTLCMASAHADSSGCAVRQQHRRMPSTHMQQQHKGSSPRHYPATNRRLRQCRLLLRATNCCFTLSAAELQPRACAAPLAGRQLASQLPAAVMLAQGPAWELAGGLAVAYCQQC